MKSMIRTWQMLAAMLIMAVSLLQAQTAEEVVKKQFDLSPGGKVIVKNVNGKILIEGWDKNQVYLVAEKHVKAGSREKARRILEHLKIYIEENPGEVYIRTKNPRGSGGGFLDWMFSRHASSYVDFELKVPRQCDLRIDDTNGSVEVIGVEGDISLETTNGKIFAEEVGGTVEAHSTNGSVETELTSLDEQGNFEFTTTNGSVRLYLPASAGFQVQASTVNGSIKTDFPLEVKGKYGSKRVRGEVNGGGPQIFLETVNGSIQIRER